MTQQKLEVLDAKDLVDQFKSDLKWRKVDLNSALQMVKAAEKEIPKIEKKLEKAKEALKKLRVKKIK